MDKTIAVQAMPPQICGVSHAGGRNMELIACGLPRGHTGEHSWATLPTFTDGMTKTEKAAQLLLRSYGEFGTIDGEWINGLDKALEVDLPKSEAQGVYLADNSKFDLEREFWCQCCGDFRDVRSDGVDIVCEACHFVIATFRDREIIKRRGALEAMR